MKENFFAVLLKLISYYFLSCPFLLMNLNFHLGKWQSSEQSDNKKSSNRLNLLVGVFSELMLLSDLLLLVAFMVLLPNIQKWHKTRVDLASDNCAVL